MNLSELVARGTILRATVGSTVHGLHHGGQDDRDEMAVFVEPPEYRLGLKLARGQGRKLHPLEHWVERTQPEGARSGPGDLDLVAYNLRKYMRLALKGHPTVLLLLFVPPELTLVETELGRELRGLTGAILSKRAGRSYLGYLRRSARALAGYARAAERQPARAGRGARLRHEVRDARRPAGLPGPRAAGDRPADAAHAGADTLARDGCPAR